MFRQTNIWLLLTDWRCFGLFLEHHHVHERTLLPLWTNEFYLSGCVFQRQSAWSEEVNVRKHFISWNRLTCSAAFPQAISVLLCMPVCVYVLVLALLINSSGVREWREGLVCCNRLKHKKYTGLLQKLWILQAISMWPKTCNLCYIYMKQIVFSTSGSFVPSSFSLCRFHIFLSLLLSLCLLSFGPFLSLCVFMLSIFLSLAPLFASLSPLSSSCQAGWFNPRLCQGLRSNKNCGGQIYFLQDTGSLWPGIPCDCVVWSDIESRNQDFVLSYILFMKETLTQEHMYRITQSNTTTPIQQILHFWSI